MGCWSGLRGHMMHLISGIRSLSRMIAVVLLMTWTMGTGAVSGTLTFPPGQTSKTFTVPIINDALKEPSESAVLALSNPVNASLGAASSATLWIADND